MKYKTTAGALILSCFVTLVALPAQAHFKLLKPTSWLNEGSDGSPQKKGPCGNGGSDDGPRRLASGVGHARLQMDGRARHGGAAVAGLLRDRPHPPVAVDGDPAHSSEDTKARRPLAAAEVVVEDVEGNPGYYTSKFFLRPHYQLEGLTVSLRLVSKLPSVKQGAK